MGGDFVKAWTLLLEYMEKAALNRNVEVCIYILSIVQEIFILLLFDFSKTFRIILVYTVYITFFILGISSWVAFVT